MNRRVPAAVVAVVALALPATAFAVGESTITSQPPAVTNSTQVTFTFESSEANDGFECKFDFGDFATCTTPFTRESLSEGQHTFAVRAKDTPGTGSGVESTPSEVTFTVDTTPPETTITEKTTGSTSTFHFTSSESGSTFLCTVDGGAESVCSSPHSVTANAGSHTLAVRAVDPAGNPDQTAASESWVVQAPPAPPPPPKPSGGGDTAPAPGPGAAPGIPLLFVGPMAVRETPRQQRPPAAARAALAPGDPPVSNAGLPDAKKKTELFQLSSRLVLHWTAVPGATSYDAQVALVPPTVGNAPPPPLPWTAIKTFTPELQADYTGAGLPGRTYCFRVRARNAQLVSSDWRTACTTHVAGAADLDASASSWQRREGAGYHRGEYLHYKAGSGAIVLDLAKPFRHVAVVATRCPSCGSIRIAVKKVTQTVGDPLPKVKTVASRTVTLTSSKTKTSRFFKLTLAEALAPKSSYRLSVTRKSGTPRIEGAAGAP